MFVRKRRFFWFFWQALSVCAILALSVVLVIFVSKGLNRFGAPAGSARTADFPPRDAESAGKTESVRETSGTAAAVSRPGPEPAEKGPLYFKGSVFLGDSVTNDMSFYKLMDSAVIVAESGLSTYTADIRTHKINGEKVMVADAVAAAGPKKIYIMLGANDVEWMTTAKYLLYYGRLIDDIEKKCPHAEIEIQSILPVSVLYEKKHPEHTNAKIEQFNQALKDMCGKRALRYVDVASALKDGSGNLPAEASDDGLHLKAKYYSKWFAYLTDHNY